jgi:hypothetical protein
VRFGPGPASDSIRVTERVSSLLARTDSALMKVDDGPLCAAGRDRVIVDEKPKRPRKLRLAPRAPATA